MTTIQSSVEDQQHLNHLDSVGQIEYQRIESQNQSSSNMHLQSSTTNQVEYYKFSNEAYADTALQGLKAPSLH